VQAFFPVCEEYLSRSAFSAPDLIIATECAVLNKQQPLMCETIMQIAGPQTIVLLSVDGPVVQPSSCITDKETFSADSSDMRSVDVKAKGRKHVQENYIDQLDRDMKSKGFLVKPCYTSAVVWEKVSDIAGTQLPPKTTLGTLYSDKEARKQEELQIHHIRCYYKPGILSLEHPLLGFGGHSSLKELILDS
jgi:hypothetical protein